VPLTFTPKTRSKDASVILPKGLRGLPRGAAPSAGESVCRVARPRSRSASRDRREHWAKNRFPRYRWRRPNKNGSKAGPVHVSHELNRPSIRRSPWLEAVENRIPRPSRFYVATGRMRSVSNTPRSPIVERDKPFPRFGFGLADDLRRTPVALENLSVRAALFFRDHYLLAFVIFSHCHRCSSLLLRGQARVIRLSSANAGTLQFPHWLEAVESVTSLGRVAVSLPFRIEPASSCTKASLTPCSSISKRCSSSRRRA
jgi:hypothetical protein